MPIGRCRLCHAESDLQLSHIVPGFIFRWVRETSANGYLRFGENPNRRVQDGLKRHWLCARCEGVLSRSETAFAEGVFYPYLNGTFSLPYEKWLLQFCVSVSWRILQLYREESHDMEEKYSPEMLQKIAHAEEAWRMFLLDRREHPGPFIQHILPLEGIHTILHPSPELSPNLNRYLMRSIQVDLCRSDMSNFVYCKLPRFIIVGVIDEKRPNQWRGARVRLRRGVIEPRSFYLPGEFFEYLNSKARHETELLGSISTRQRERIEQSFRENAKRFVGTDAFFAMQNDIAMFGDDAFTQSDPESGPSS